MIIRKANTKDSKQLVSLYLEYQKEEEKLSELYKERWQLTRNEISKYVREAISKQNSVVIVLENEEVLEGFIMGSFEKKNDALKNYGSIDEIYVVQKIRGKGFSSKLKEEFVNWFKEKKKGRGVISLHVMPTNEIAKKSYQKWGFEVSDLRLVKEIK